MATDIRILTLNVNGMKDSVKRSQVFAFCRARKVGVACLQECHVSNLADKKFWTKQWGGVGVWSLGTNSAKGVGTLLSPRWSLRGSKVDTEGRVVSVLISDGESTYNVVNVYAPGTSGERKTFFASLHRYMFPNAELVVVGDFNCVLDPGKDRTSASVFVPGRGAQDVKELSALVSDLELSDAWREEHPTELEYTWRSPSNASRSRLDRIYIPVGLESESVIEPCTFSDHDAVVTAFKTANGVKRGRGLWKCNTSVVTDPGFILDFTDQYQTWRESRAEYQSLRAWWDDVKLRAKELVIQYSKRKARLLASIHKNSERKVDLLRSRLNAGDTSPQTLREYNEAREEVNKSIQDKLAGQRLRSKVKHFEEDEKPTRSFFQAERTRGAKKIIPSVRSSDGTVVSSPEEILDVFHDFYEDLYTADQLNQPDKEYFLNNLDSTLPVDSASSLELPLSLTELEEAMKGMENNKSPGSDGLPKEWYSQFWPLLGQDLLEVLNEGFTAGQLSSQQREGVITLLEKKGDPLSPANRRPISLLNVDYKILSKALANRLKRVAQEVVHPNQSCGIPGRSIEDSVTLLRDVAEYVNSKNLPCVFLALDQEKAFDRVDHRYMVEVLDKLGFGPNFQRWIRALYTNVTSKVLVNGFLSDPVNIGRGVRQGCPLSPLLYVLCLEPLAATIRADPDIKGVQIPGGDGAEVKLVQYADDNTCVLTDQYSIDRTFHTLGRFESGTGSKLNMGKTEALWLGCWRGRRDEPYPIKRWTSSFLVILGTQMGNIPLAEEAWLKRFAKFKEKLTKWEDRKLTLFGKAVVVNFLAAATLWYAAPVYPLPQSVLRKIEKEMFTFVWDGKTELVNRRTMFLPKEKGGVGLVDVRLKANAILLKCVRKALLFPQDPAMRFVHYWLGISLRHIDPDSWSNSAPHSIDRPAHYKVIRDLITSVSESCPSFDWKSGSVSVLYNTLLEAEGSVPRCIQRFPQVDWTVVWRVVHNPLNAIWDKIVSWKALHDALKTRQKLHSWRGLVASSTCPRRGCTQSESVEHLFLDCAVVQEMWAWVEHLVDKRILKGFRLTAAFALRGEVPSNTPKKTRVVLEALSVISRAYVWRSRCLVVFEKAHHSARSGSDILIQYSHGGVASKQATSVRRHDEKDMPTQRTNHPEVSPWITGELVCVTVFGLVWGWIESRRYARVAASGELHRRWESVRASRDVREPRTAPPSERALHTVLERHCRVKEFPWGRGEVHVGVSQVSRDQFGRGRDNFTRLKAEFAIAKGGGVSGASLSPLLAATGSVIGFCERRSARSGSDILIQYSHGGVASKQATSVRRHDEKDMPTQRTNHPEVSPWITGELVCVTVFGLVWGWIESRRYARVAASGELHRRWESVRASRDVREPRTAPPSERALHTVLERHCRVKEFPWGRGEVHVGVSQVSRDQFGRGRDNFTRLKAEFAIAKGGGVSARSGSDILIQYSHGGVASKQATSVRRHDEKDMPTQRTNHPEVSPWITGELVCVTVFGLVWGWIESRRYARVAASGELHRRWESVRASRDVREPRTAPPSERALHTVLERHCRVKEFPWGRGEVHVGVSQVSRDQFGRGRDNFTRLKAEFAIAKGGGVSARSGSDILIQYSHGGVASKQATSVRRHDEKDMPTQRTNHPEVSPWITGELVCVTVFGLVWGWIESRRYARVAASGELHRRWESVRASRDVREPRTAPPSERALHTVLERHCRVKEFPWGRGEVHVGVSQVSRDQFGRGRDNFTRLKAEFAIAKGGGVSGASLSPLLAATGSVIGFCERRSARSGSDILIQYSHGGVASKQATSVRRHDEKDMPTQRTNHPEVSPWITGELVCVTVFGLVWGWIESRRYARVAASGELHRRWESVRASRDVREPRTAPPSERALHTVLERHCRVKEFPWGRVGSAPRSGSDILIQYSHGGVASKQATSVRRHDEKDMPTQRTNHPEVSPWITGELVCVTVFGLVWGWIESRRYARVAASGELHRRWESVRASRDVREPRTAPPSERALHTVLERHCRVKEFPWGRGEVHVPLFPPVSCHGFCDRVCERRSARSGSDILIQYSHGGVASKQATSVRRHDEKDMPTQRTNHPEVSPWITGELVCVTVFGLVWGWIESRRYARVAASGELHRRWESVRASRDVREPRTAPPSERALHTVLERHCRVKEFPWGRGEVHVGVSQVSRDHLDVAVTISRG
ncbi:hypothetical protein Bbelb_436820 [Branchiostoma belcheri]|nr:hypothetical protein Bbelb_436820 [Branchiostoma belcheri]